MLLPVAVLAGSVGGLYVYDVCAQQWQQEGERLDVYGCLDSKIHCKSQSVGSCAKST